MVNDDLFDFFKTNTLLIDHGYSLSELENMSPFERTVYTKLLTTKLEKKANESAQ